MRRFRFVLVGLLSFALVGAVAAPAMARIKFTKIQYESPGPDTGSNSSLNAEYLVIKNTGTQAKQLQGWQVKDLRNSLEGGNIVFTFPLFRLRPGRTVTLHTGQGAKTRTDLYWGRSNYVWGDDSDTAYLYNKAGRQVDRCHYVSTTQQTSPPAAC